MGPVMRVGRMATGVWKSGRNGGEFAAGEAMGRMMKGSLCGAGN